MTKTKLDGVVEAVHYQSDGKVAWVRAYLRRGATYSDWVLLPRNDFLQLLKSGKNIVAGKRLPLLASTFQIQNPIHIFQHNDQDILVTGVSHSERDCLDGVPVI